MGRLNIFILLLLLFASEQAYSQTNNFTMIFKDHEDLGDEFFEHMAYESAIEMYERVYNSDDENADVAIKIAKSQYKLRVPLLAKLWFERAMSVIEREPEAMFEYIQVLLQLDRYDEAKTWLYKYKAERPNDSRTVRILEFLQRLNLYMTDSVFRVRNLPINTRWSEFGLAEYDEGFIFLSNRYVSPLTRHAMPWEAVPKAPYDYYYSQYDSFGYSAPEILKNGINTRFHEGTMAVLDNGNHILFTSNAYSRKSLRKQKVKTTHLGIFEANKDSKGKWSEPIPTVFNNESYSVAHPTISHDEQTLVFASNMNGGQGGLDLYISQIVDGKWGAPKNLGSQINTEGDESFPHLSEDGELFFSSDGHGGFGGLDIFYTASVNSSLIINFGHPINSSMDDISIRMHPDGQSGYFASNRLGGRGMDDIYSFTVDQHMIHGKVVANELRLDSITVEVLDEHQDVFKLLKTNNLGEFDIKLPKTGKFTFIADKEGFSLESAKTILIDTMSHHMGHIELDMWKHDLFLRGTVYSHNTERPMAGASITLYNSTNETYQTISPGKTGTYEFVLRPDQAYTLSLEKRGYYKKAIDISTKGIRQGALNNDFVLEEEFLEKAIVTFASNKTYVDRAGVKTLQLMLKVLRENPDTFVIIIAHADSKGDAEYNKKLSHDRATSVQKYFEKYGIESERIVARGLGEELLINECRDGINCEENDHSQNRRAEIKIQYLHEEEAVDY